MSSSLTRWAVGLGLATVAMGLLLAHAARTQEIAGAWHGRLQVPSGAALRIGLQVSRTPDGRLSGFLTSPDQTPHPIPLGTVRMEAGKLVFDAPAVGASYQGAWDGARQAWAGKLKQGGLDMPLTFKKGPPPQQASAPATARPQTPKPPFPYRSLDVAFDSVPGVRLAGTLTLPEGAGPFPAAVLITGSGPQDRDETILGHKPFLVLADNLTRRGIAVLRVDDRGVGQSTGERADATTADFAKDTEAAVRFLRTRRDIDPARIGLIGHSEGGIIAPMVADADRRIAFVVLMAGSAVPGAEVLQSQREAIERLAGASPEAIARTEAQLAKISAAVADTTTPKQALARLETEFPGLPPARAKAVVDQLGSPWMRWFAAYDPRPALEKLRIPVLALNGSKDTQVVPQINVPAMRQALKDDPKATVIELPGLNHLFQDAGTGAPSEYATIQETLSPLALKTIGDWVTAQTKR